MLATAAGVAWGVLIPVWANALVKRRYFMKPWRHLVFGVTGGFIGYNWAKWEDELFTAVNAKRKAFGLPQYRTKTDVLPSIDEKSA